MRIESRQAFPPGFQLAINCIGCMWGVVPDTLLLFSFVKLQNRILRTRLFSRNRPAETGSCWHSAPRLDITSLSLDLVVFMFLSCRITRAVCPPSATLSQCVSAVL